MSVAFDNQIFANGLKNNRSVTIRLKGNEIGNGGHRAWSFISFAKSPTRVASFLAGEGATEKESDLTHLFHHCDSSISCVLFFRGSI